MSVLIKSADDTKDILGLLVLINPRCPQYETSFGGKNSGITGLDVSGSLAGLPEHVQRYAFLLGEGLKVESYYQFSYPEKPEKQLQTVTSGKNVGAIYMKTPEVTKPKAESLKENTQLLGTKIKSGDFYRVRNALRRLVEKELIESKVTPKTATIPQIAQGLAGCALFQKVKAKGHCKQCIGQGWTKPLGYVPALCSVCLGSGQAGYTLEERAKLSGMTITKVGYQKTWESFERWAVSELCDWENEIRNKLLGLVRTA